MKILPTNGSAARIRLCVMVILTLLTIGLHSEAVELNAGEQVTEVGFVPNEIIVKFSPAVPSNYRQISSRGFGSLLNARQARELDDTFSNLGVRRLRRVFSRLEAPNGTLERTGAEFLARARRKFLARAARASAAAVTRASAANLERYVVVELDRNHSYEELKSIAEQLENNPLVESADIHPTGRIFATSLPSVSYIPNDPFLAGNGTTWAESAFGNSYPNLFGHLNIHVLEAWDQADTNRNGAFDAGETPPGAGVIVAVVDSGVDVNHPDLAGNIYHNPGEIPNNGIDDDDNGFVDDVTGWDFSGLDSHLDEPNEDNDPNDSNGHGTHVAGTIAAVANNSTGIVGVAPFAKILPVRVGHFNGTISFALAAEGVLYATAMGAHILSNSWGGPMSDSALDAALDTAEAAGVLVVVAAGNEGQSEAKYPARRQHSISVASLNRSNGMALYSNIGKDIDIAAPGDNILSLNAHSGSNALADLLRDRVVDTHYLVLSGTSMACPHVSGVAALIISADPLATVDEIRVRLATGADTADLVPDQSNALGAGRADALGSVRSTTAPLLRISKLEPPLIRDGASAIRASVTNYGSPISSGDILLDVFEQGPSDGFGEIGTGVTILSDELEIYSPGLPFGTPVTIDAEISNDVSGPDSEEITTTIGRFVPAPAVTTLDDPIELTPYLTTALTSADFNGDRRPDLLVAGGLDLTAVYLQEDDGRYEISRVFDSNVNVLTIDVDGDHDLDVVTSNDNGSKLYKNGGAGTFTNSTSGSGLGPGKPYHRSTMIDLEGDGDLDIIGFGPNRVFENDGSGAFTDVTGTSGISLIFDLPFLGLHAAAFDYDLDEDQDLIVVSSEGLQVVYLFGNDGDGEFTDVTASVFDDIPLTCGGFCGFPPWGRYSGPSGLALADYDADLDIDVFIPGMFRSVSVAPGNRDQAFMLRNDGDGTFSNQIATAGDIKSFAISAGHWSTAFVDVDNDADIDLYMGNDALGYSIPGKTPIGRNSIFANDGSSEYNRIPDSEVAAPITQRLRAHSVSLSDINRDGTIDVVAGASGIGIGGIQLNLDTDDSWLAYSLAADSSNPMSIGATVTLTNSSKSQHRIIYDSPLEVGIAHFGLGANVKDVDEVLVQWPSGASQKIVNERARRTRFIYESTASACSIGDDDDADGICNADDNCLQAENGSNEPSSQLDSDLDGLGNYCDPDFNNSGRVTIVDFSPLLAAMGKSFGQPGYVEEVDLDGNGIVDETDYDVFYYYFSRASGPGPSGLACADPRGGVLCQSSDDAHAARTSRLPSPR